MIPATTFYYWVYILGNLIVLSTVWLFADLAAERKWSRKYRKEFEFWKWLYEA